MRIVLLFLFYSSMVLAQCDIEEAKKFQIELNQSFADSLKSPLTRDDLMKFKSLDFYTIDQKYCVEAIFIRTKREKAFEMKTTTDRKPLYRKYGELHFTLDGKAFKLNVYENLALHKKQGYEDYLFLPFSDLSCGKESYIGGRYVDLRKQNHKIWRVDFNKSYNPYCAYNYKYSCPIVPMENDLDTFIYAGVKKFHD